MIRTPPRAVTRFLIPFIDVLILLFCIFLLMPFVSQPGDDPTAAPVELESLKQELARAERRLADLKNERANLFDRFHVKLLEIDRETGRLYAFDPELPGRQEIRSQNDATKLIHRERTRAGAREVCILLLYPRELTGFPVREQIDRYRYWFRDVPHTVDNPWSG